MHRELDRKGMTLMLLWQEYVGANPGGRTWRYTQFCEHYKVNSVSKRERGKRVRCTGATRKANGPGEPTEAMTPTRNPQSTWTGIIGSPVAKRADRSSTPSDRPNNPPSGAPAALEV